ncbi:LacI family DNA-binding transcriptional regulator [Microbacterium sp. JZ101]
MSTGARATRDDVARLAGVSTAVVSYVLNDGPRPVAPDTRKRVLKAMKELNYRPNASARALATQRTRVLGLIVPDLSNPFFAEFGSIVQNAAFARGYALLLGETNSDPARERSQVSSMLEREVDGLMTFGIQDAELVDMLSRTDMALVSMDWQLSAGSVATVMVDDYQASRDAVAHLAEHGHRAIAFIGGPGNLLVSQDRRRGWRDEMRARFGDEQVEHLAYEAPHTREGGYEAARAIFASAEPPSAVFVGTDAQAIGVLHACHESGVHVPEELAIVSFDGTKESAFSSPPMTSIQLPMAEMAKLALDRLLAQGARDGDLHVIVEHELVLRGSCGEHPASS